MKSILIYTLLLCLASPALVAARGGENGEDPAGGSEAKEASTSGMGTAGGSQAKDAPSSGMTMGTAMGTAQDADDDEEGRPSKRASDIGPALPGVPNPHKAGGVPTVPMPDHAGLSGKAALPLPPLEPGPGILEGHVVHQASEKAVLEGLEVKLLAVEQGQVRKTWQTETGTDGGFRFTGLDTRTAVNYRVSTTFQGAAYEDGGQFSKDTSALQVDIPVFDSASAPGQLQVQGMHVILDTQPTLGTAQVTEMLSFSNPSQVTLIGGDENTVTLVLDLPPGADDLQIGAGFEQGEIGVGDNKLYYTGPIYPGPTQVLISYRLPPQAMWMFRRTMEIPIQSLDVFVKQGGPEVLSPLLSSADTLTLRGATYQRYQGGPFPAGKQVFFQVGGAAPQSAGAASSDSSSSSTAVLVVALAVAGFVFWPLMRKSAPLESLPASSDPQARRVALLVEERDRNMLAVKELDFDYASNKLSEEDYQTLRAKHKAEAIHAMRELEGVRQGPSSVGASSPGGPPVASVSGSTSRAGEGAAAGPVPRVLPQKFCTQCGNLLLPDHKFCGHCGAVLTPPAES